MSDVKLFSYEEVAKHNTRNDLWMIVSGKVYDITAFVDEVSLFFFLPCACLVWFIFFFKIYIYN